MSSHLFIYLYSAQIMAYGVTFSWFGIVTRWNHHMVLFWQNIIYLILFFEQCEIVTHHTDLNIWKWKHYFTIICNQYESLYVVSYCWINSTTHGRFVIEMREVLYIEHWTDKTAKKCSCVRYGSVNDWQPLAAALFTYVYIMLRKKAAAATLMD